MLGASGTGKSTLLNLIASIDRPDSGRIVIDGADITQMSRSQLAAWRAANIGYIFQTHNLIPVLTAYENVELPLLLLRMSRAERRRRVELALQAVGLSDRADHYPRQLSGGQEQRIGIARAIVAHPKVVVADEPTGDLDEDTAAQILRLLKQLNHQLGTTLLMVTHDPDAAAMAARQLRLDHGQLHPVRRRPRCGTWSCRFWPPTRCVIRGELVIRRQAFNILSSLGISSFVIFTAGANQVMLRFTPYLLKTLWRHRSRTMLTVSGSAVALFVFCFVGAIQEGMNELADQQQADSSLIVFQANKFCPATSHLPQDYERTIARIEGVREVVPIQVFTNNCRASLDVVVFYGLPAERIQRVRDLQLTGGDWSDFRRHQDAAVVGAGSPSGGGCRWAASSPSAR